MAWKRWASSINYAIYTHKPCLFWYYFDLYYQFYLLGVLQVPISIYWVIQNRKGQALALGCGHINSWRCQISIRLSRLDKEVPPDSFIQQQCDHYPLYVHCNCPLWLAISLQLPPWWHSWLMGSVQANYNVHYSWGFLVLFYASSNAY